jgi:hypothetical protein
MVDLPEQERSALSAVVNALAAPQALLTSWHANELFAEVESNGLHCRVGHANSPNVLELGRRYERSSHRPLPPLLASLLSTFNGLNVEETSDGEVTVTREPSVRDVWDGILAVEDVEVDETSDGKFAGLHFATAYAQARVLLVYEGEHAGAVVFDDAKGTPVIVADSLTDFLLEVARTGVSVERVVGKKI